MIKNLRLWFYKVKKKKKKLNKLLIMIKKKNKHKHKQIMFVTFVRLFMSRNGSSKDIKGKKFTTSLELITDRQEFSKVYKMKFRTYLEVLYMNFIRNLTGLSLQIIRRRDLLLTKKL